MSKPQPKPKPLHHGGTEARRKQKIKWILFGPLIPGVSKIQSFDISNSFRRQKAEDTEKAAKPRKIGESQRTASAPRDLVFCFIIICCFYRRSSAQSAANGFPLR